MEKLQLWHGWQGPGSRSSSGCSTGCSSGCQHTCPEREHSRHSCPRRPFLPPRRRCAPAAFQPPLVFLAGGSPALRAQQFPARANAFLYSPITGPSCHLPTLLLDAAALPAPTTLPLSTATTLPQFPHLGPPRFFWESEQSLGVRDAEVGFLVQFWSAKGGDVCPYLPVGGLAITQVGFPILQAEKIKKAAEQQWDSDLG